MNRLQPEGRAERDREERLDVLCAKHSLKYTATRRGLDNRTTDTIDSASTLMLSINVSEASLFFRDVVEILTLQHQILIRDVIVRWRACVICLGNLIVRAVCALLSLSTAGTLPVRLAFMLRRSCLALQ